MKEHDMWHWQDLYDTDKTTRITDFIKFIFKRDYDAILFKLVWADAPDRRRK